MTRERKLRREAREGATRRGHDMTRTLKGGEAMCRRCGMGAHVVPGYSYEVFGDAVALNCPGS
jgi:hypothetical protein